MFKDYSRAVGYIILSFFIIVIISVGFWWIRVENADRIGRGNAEIQIESAENRIATYNHFFDLCVSVKDAEVAIDGTASQIKATTDQHTINVLQTNLTAQQNTRAQGINQYNADAKKNYTDARFLAMNLPYQLSEEPYVAGGEKTQCAR